MLISLDTANVDLHRAVAHLLPAYHAELLKHAPVNLKEVKTMYVQTHTLPSFATLTVPSTTLPPTITPIFFANGYAAYYARRSSQDP